jgi:hypothetical protein
VWKRDLKLQTSMPPNQPQDVQPWLLVELFASAAADGSLEWQHVYAAGEETVIVSPAGVERIAATWPGVHREVAPDLGPDEAVERARRSGFPDAPTAIAVRFLSTAATHSSYVVAYEDGRSAAIDATSGAVSELL